MKRDNSIPVFVRTGESIPLGNNKLLELGAIPWTNEIDVNNLKSQLIFLSENRKRKEKDVNLFNIIEQNNIKNEPLDSKREVYEVVLPIILKYIESINDIDELAQVLNITKTQLNIWLTLAVSEKRLKELSQPVRYIKI